MLDNNTNKVVWVGVAIGVVVVIGSVTMLLFPSVTDAIKPMIRESMLVTQATPAFLRSPGDHKLTTASTASAWNGYYLYLSRDVIEIPSKSYIYYEVMMKTDKDSHMTIDINNANTNQKETDNGNDNDDVSYRKVELIDENGDVQHVTDSNGGTYGPNKPAMKAGHWYKMTVKYRNISDHSIYENYKNAMAKTTAVVFRPDGDMHQPVTVTSKDFKMNIVHF